MNNSKKNIVLTVVIVLFYIVVNSLYFLSYKDEELFLFIEQIYVLNLLFLPLIICSVTVVAFCALLILKNKISIPALTVLGISLFFLFLYYYTSTIEPQWLKVRKVSIHSDKVIDPITLIHISDIQSGRIGRYEEKVFQRIVSLDPDIVIHTGDLIQPFHKSEFRNEFKKVCALFRTLTPDCRVYNIHGNVDGMVDFDEFDSLTGVQTLVDKNDFITVNNSSISLLGLSLSSSVTGNRTWLKEWANNNRENIFTILFGHSPN